ncbi:MAG: endonuclease/exonuclease/phosphatase family protein [Clostridia bacterium]|nr:endonuclease/exonuclease/phosphatase family protein [Clostridia bacterium]
MKKYLALFLAIVLALSMLGGCSTAPDEGLGTLDTEVPDVEVESDIDSDQEKEPNNSGEKPSDPTEKPSEDKPSSQKSAEKPDEDKKDEPSKEEPSKDEPAKEEKPGNDPVEDEEKEEKPIDYSSWIKVASYNIKALVYNHENPETPSDQFEDVVKVLREIDADIVGLQEVDYFKSRSGSKDQVKELAEELGYPYYHFTKTIDSGGGEYGHAVMSRYPIKSSKEWHFPDDINATEPRAFSRHVIDIKGKQLIFYNSHLAQKSPEQLIYMMDRFMEKEAKDGKAVVMTADYNAKPVSLIGCFELDAFTLLNGGDEFDNALKTTVDDGGAIDNILVSDNLDYYWDAEKKCGIKVIETTASDHYPLYTYINFK